MTRKELDLSCISYLASGKVLQIDSYPQLNYGTEVLRIIDTIAADGPMVAIAASHLGLKAGFIGNDVGEDSEGKDLLDLFKKNGVATVVEVDSTIKTPFIIILSDKNENREWFPYVPRAVSDLNRVDLSFIKTASLVYIDFYSLLRQPAERAVSFASEWGVPIFLNLGASSLSLKEAEFLRDKGVAVVQTNLEESQSLKAREVAQQLFESVKSEISIVTLGRKGAVAFTASSFVSVPAYKVKVLHVHGAGAAFSAGFAFGYLHRWDLERSLQFACALGSLNCTIERGFDSFSREDVEHFIEKWSK